MTDITDPHWSTWPANVAVKAGTLQSSAVGDRYLRRLRRAALTERVQVQREDAQLELARQVPGARPRGVPSRAGRRARHQGLPGEPGAVRGLWLTAANSPEGPRAPRRLPASSARDRPSSDKPWARHAAFSPLRPSHCSRSPKRIAPDSASAPICSSFVAAGGIATRNSRPMVTMRSLVRTLSTDLKAGAPSPAALSSRSWSGPLPITDPGAVAAACSAWPWWPALPGSAQRGDEARAGAARGASWRCRRSSLCGYVTRPRARGPARRPPLRSRRGPCRGPCHARTKRLALRRSASASEPLDHASSRTMVRGPGAGSWRQRALREAGAALAQGRP